MPTGTDSLRLGQPATLARVVIFAYCCTVCVTDAELTAMFESPK